MMAPQQTGTTTSRFKDQQEEIASVKTLPSSFRANELPGLGQLKVNESVVCTDTMPQGSQGTLWSSALQPVPPHSRLWRCWGVHGHGQLGQAGRQPEMGWHAAQPGTTHPSSAGMAGVAGVASVAALPAWGRGGYCE